MVGLRTRPDLVHEGCRLSPHVRAVRPDAGPLAVPAGIEAVAFVNTPYVNASLDFPDVEIVLMSISPSSSEGERYLLDSGLTKEVSS